MLFSEIQKNPELLNEEALAWVRKVLEYVKKGNKIKDWVLITRYEPSDRTKKQFNLPEGWKHNVYWQPSTNKVQCTCPAFIFNKNCIHSRKIKLFIEECQNEKILSKI